jgi:hypothetical protein
MLRWRFPNCSKCGASVTLPTATLDDGLVLPCVHHIQVSKGYPLAREALRHRSMHAPKRYFGFRWIPCAVSALDGVPEDGELVLDQPLEEYFVR